MIIRKAQIEDFMKLLLKHPKPLWSGDVASNEAMMVLKRARLCVEEDDGWHLTAKALGLVRLGNLSVE